MDLNKYFRNARERLGLTQEEFGRLFGVSARTVMRWEQGLSQPSQYQADIIAKITESDNLPDDDFLKKALIVGGVAFGLYKLLELIFKED